MTVITDSYTAQLVGPGTTLVRREGAAVTFDDTRAPHVSMTLPIAIPSLATIAALDPRLSPRPRVSVTATSVGPFGTRTRTLTLYVDEVSEVDITNRTMTLSLVSGEAVVGDYAPGADDLSTFGMASSVRQIVNRVLAGAVPGAPTLAASPAVDADVTPFWAVTNRVLDPSGTSTAGWSGVYQFDHVEVGTTAPDTGSTFIKLFRAGGFGSVSARLAADSGVSPGDKLSFTLRARNGATRAGVRFLDGSGALVGDVWGPTTAAPSFPSWADIASGVITAPPRAAQAFPMVEGMALNSGQSWWEVDSFLFYDNPHGIPVPYFDGGSTLTGYTIVWRGAVNGSASTRTPLQPSDPGSVIWRAGVSGLEFLRPLLQSRGLRLVCDEAGVWTLRDADYETGAALGIREAVNAHGLTERLARSSGEWFDAAITVYTWTDADGTHQATDVYAPPGYTLMRKIEKQTPYPGGGFSQYAVQRAKGRGRVITATAVADWTAKAEQPVQFIYSTAPIQTGKISRLEIDLDSNEMTITARTTDTPAGAWSLIPVGERWIDSPVGGSWTGEAI